MPNPSHLPQAYSKASIHDLKDGDVLSTLTIMIWSQTLKHLCIKDQWQYPNRDQGTISKWRITRILHSPKSGRKDIDVLCIYKIRIECSNSEHGCFKDLWPYPNKDPDAEPQSGPSSILKIHKSGLGCSFKLQSRNIGVSKTSDYIQIKIQKQTPSREPPASFKAQIRTWRALSLFALLKSR